MDEVFARLREKLRRAAELPGSGDVFGAKAHGFRMRPPLPEADVAAFERAHGVRLPEPYRAFVTEFGDGGAGPDYGVLPLADAAGMIVDDPVSRLAEASPFEADRVYGPQWWDELYDREGDDAEHCRGALAVVHGGCALYTLLVVTGPARGRLVRVDLDGGLAPLVLDDVDFLAWYERWLDDVIAGYGTTFFHDRLLGGEVAFVAGARDADPARRARAVSSFNALPEVSEAGRRAVVAAVGDPDARVRAAALWTARRLRIGEAVSAVRGALTHPEAETRRMALGTLSALGCADLPGLARGLLADPVGAVVAAAVLALQEAGALTVADVAPLVRSVDVGVRVAAVHGLREAHGDVTGLVAGALADPEARVRWTAVQAAEKRGLSGLRPVLARLLEAEEDPTVLVNLRRVVPALEVR